MAAQTEAKSGYAEPQHARHPPIQAAPSGAGAAGVGGGGGGVRGGRPVRRELGEVPVSATVEGDIQLDAVAGVHEHHCLIALECSALGGERLPRNAGDPSCVSNEGHDGGRRGLGWSV